MRADRSATLLRTNVRADRSATLLRTLQAPAPTSVYWARANAVRLLDAEEAHRRILLSDEAKLGPSHRQTLAAVHSLALLLRAQGRLDEAEPLLRRALAGYDAALGPLHATSRILSGFRQQSLSSRTKNGFLFPLVDFT